MASSCGGGNGDTPLWLDRGYARGFDNVFFADKFSTDVWLDEDTQTVRLLGVLDRSILEVFLNNGAKAGTMTFFTEGVLDTGCYWHEGFESWGWGCGGGVWIAEWLD